MSSCLYNNSFNDFLKEDETLILGKLYDNYHGDTPETTKESWREEISVMKRVLSSFSDKGGQIIFEYNIPRLGKRIDVVLLYKGIIFCLEFKTGNQKIKESHKDQVLDYSLDLKNFHKYSQEKIVAPIVVDPELKKCDTTIKMSGYDNKIVNPLCTGEKDLKKIIEIIITLFPNEDPVDPNWIISPYSPTPTIIEAARTLYENHSVADITRHEADNVFIDKTIEYILNVIKESKEKKQKSICFITGVPGAGKTLVGLDVAIKQTYQGQTEPVENESAVYLSGNGPLVAVLNEALAQDNCKKCKMKGQKKLISDSRREVAKSIQMIHRYRDIMLSKIKKPIINGVLEIDTTKAVENDEAGYSEVEHVAIFDEAQRSWTQKKLAEYLNRGGTYGNKIKVKDFPVSEAAFLIWSLDQRKDWATIVCLVGGGQEINTGEAGIAEWIKAINEYFKHWHVYISPKLTEKEYAEGKVEELLHNTPNVTNSECLHLNVTLRSIRTEKLASFVHSLLTFDDNAKSLYQDINNKYPIVLTRDIDKAKQWIRDKALGKERTGLLITKESARYKPLSIHVLPSKDSNTVHWFLEDVTDVRASNYLEDAATEIQVQGLELDYTCLVWDADMRYEKGKWEFYCFNNRDKWNKQNGKTEANQDKIKYMLNAYRVLLTRARSGMVICVPEGNSNKKANGAWEDQTRLPKFYDGTYNYLKSLGIQEI